MPRDRVLPKVATVHEKTVTRAAEIIEGQRVRRRSPVRRVSKVRSVSVDIRVWETAMRLAGGDPFRITVVSETEVVVHNHPQAGHLGFHGESP